MLRRLLEQDNRLVIDFLMPEAAMNLFLLGDIENNGYDEDFQEVWGDFSDRGDLRAVLLRYYDGFIVYAMGEWDARAVASKIMEYPEALYLQGKEGVIETLEGELERAFAKKRKMYFAELRDSDRLDEANEGIPVKKVRAIFEDVDRLLSLRGEIAEFSQKGPDARERMLSSLKKGSGRAVYIEEKGEMLASASTTAENQYSAMIVGVATHPNARRKGYASVCMSAICREVLGEGKTLCLFYDNPQAGTIYKRLGFRDIGKWSMYQFQ